MTRKFSYLPSSSKNNGFTLVELSIVLVIIGLIVGGIVGGQSLIQAAKINNVIQDIIKFRTAVNTFELQYNALPGDMPDAYDYWNDGTDDVCGSSATDEKGCNGNGSGLIGDGGGYHNLDEGLRVWVHLMLAEILPISLPGYDWTASGGPEYRDTVTIDGMGSRAGGTGPTAPLSSIREGTGYAIVNPAQSSSWTPSTFYGRVGAWIMLTHPAGGKSGTVNEFFAATVTPITAYAIDKKMDDGLPTMGNVFGARAWSSGSGGQCTSASSRPYEMDTETPSTSTTYLLSNPNKGCNPLFYLGGR